jgi:hypothetical protein
MIPFVCAMPDECKIATDTVINYRNYYNTKKKNTIKNFAKWTNRPVPEFYESD